MATGDVYQVTDVQTMNGSQLLNVYYYEQRGDVLPLPPTPNVAAVLADQWADQILPTLALPQVDDVTHTNVIVRNLFDPADWYDLSVDEDGGYSNQDGNAPFVTYTFKLTGGDHSIRPGGKRIGGVPEAAGSNGVITDVTTIGYLEDIEEIILTPVTAGDIIPVDTWFPVIVKRVREGTPGSYTYRLPENSEETTLTDVLQAAISLLLSTMNSRKFGIGA